MPEHLSEFLLIEKYFSQLIQPRKDVVLGIGDDAAAIKIPPNNLLVTCVDTLVENIHFFSDLDPCDIAYKALAVNLSDIAAMGATPAWFTLALTLPDATEEWLSRFSTGLLPLMQDHELALIGGDITRGPLSVTISVCGYALENQLMKRSGAQPNDLIYVTGELGGAGLALHLLNEEKNVPSELLSKLLRPSPRITEGKLLVSYANSAIDISDGFLADLNHLCHASCVGAEINLERLPIAKELSIFDSPFDFALNAGDDYELIVTIPSEHQKEVEKLMQSQLTCVGKITKEQGVRTIDGNGSVQNIISQGYQHF